MYTWNISITMKQINYDFPDMVWLKINDYIINCLNYNSSDEEHKQKL